MPSMDHSLGSKQTWIKRVRITLWSHTGIDKVSILQMLKAGLPPVTVLSMYQATSIAEIEFTVGYLAAILTISAQCLFPRGKFMKILSFSVISTCCSAALTCLVVLCSVRARQHSTSAKASRSVSEGYNSSASTVCAIWLLFSIWLANTLRALRPVELQDPMVAMSIFSAVSMTRAPTFLTVSEGLHFVRMLLVTFLIGLAVAAVVSLFIHPTTSRKNVFKAINAYPEAIKKLFDAEIAFIRVQKNHLNTEPESKHAGNARRTSTDIVPEEKDIMSALATLRGLRTKSNAEMTYAKLEMAWGKLSQGDLRCILDHVRLLDLSLSGISTFPEISSRLFVESSDENGNSASSVQGFPWQTFRTALAERLVSTAKIAATGMDAALKLLEVLPSYTSACGTRHSSLDVEKQTSRPGNASTDTSEIFRAELRKYEERRRNLHQIWPSLLKRATTEGDVVKPLSGQDNSDHLRLFIFMEQAQNEIVQAVHGLLRFAETKVSDGSMRSNKIILPHWPRLRGRDLLMTNGRNCTSSNAPASPHARPAAADAERLPPVNLFERCGDRLRVMSNALTSAESVFGFRVAVASFTVAILAYLRQTQEFFGAQRLIWAMIVIVIGMKPESGASIFGYLARVVSTVVAMILSLIVWYIVDGHTVGVLVILYLANVFLYYFWVRFPRFLGPCTIAIVTLNVIVGYQLQANKLGIEKATSNGQPYYPLYLFGPYKLLCVLAGVSISFFWTVFPRPVATRTRVRRTLGRSLYLLANLYSCVHSSVKLWINEQQGDLDDPSSAGGRLQGTCQSIYSDQNILLAQAEDLIHWTTYGFQIGGKFPKRSYRAAIGNLHILANCMALMSHTTRDIDVGLPRSDMLDSEPRAEGSKGRWTHHLARACNSPQFDSHLTTSLLCQLAGAISSNCALPPSLTLPEPFPLARKVGEINKEALRIENIQDPTFSAFACMEMTTSLISSRLEDLTANVKALVGEISFDIHDIGDGNKAQKML